MIKNSNRLCWEQNVHVIVMLTKEVESATVKCGNYWAEGTYGPLRLKLLETTDTPEREKQRRESEMASGFFNMAGPPRPKPSKSRPKHKDKRGQTTGTSTSPDEEGQEENESAKRAVSRRWRWCRK